MKKYALIFLLVLAALQGAQALLGVLKDQNPTQEASPNLFLLNSYRIILAPALAGLITIVPLLGQYILVPKKLKHSFRQEMLKIMRSKIFQNHPEVRISIFKDAGWTRVFLIYLWENICQPLVWYRGKSMYTWPKWGKYIKVSEREGTEHSKSKTYFFVSKGSWRESEGIAAVARHQNGEKDVHDLADINGIDLFKLDMSEPLGAEALIVQEYMKRSFICNLEALKRVHIKARHLYANVLLDKDRNTVAVLVVDSSNSGTSLITEDAMTRIEGYIELFTSTFLKLLICRLRPQQILSILCSSMCRRLFRQGIALFQEQGKMDCMCRVSFFRRRSPQS